MNINERRTHDKRGRPRHDVRCLNYCSTYPNTDSTCVVCRAALSPKAVVLPPEESARRAHATSNLLGFTCAVKPDYFVHARSLADLRARLLAHLDQHGQITPLEWKDIVGASRKYSIPLAEHSDAEKVTLRVGEIRKRRG